MRTFRPFLDQHTSTIALAHLYLAEQNPSEALSTARIALELADRSGFPAGARRVQRVLAHAYDCMRASGEAESEFRASLDIWRTSVASRVRPDASGLRTRSSPAATWAAEI